MKLRRMSDREIQEWHDALKRVRDACGLGSLAIVFEEVRLQALAVVALFLLLTLAGVYFVRLRDRNDDARKEAERLKQQAMDDAERAAAQEREQARQQKEQRERLAKRAVARRLDRIGRLANRRPGS